MVQEHPDFPGSAADRERGKFRPSATARQTVVAVTSDTGVPLSMSTDELLGEILTQLRINNAHLAFITGEDPDVSDD